jgi:hypothetical protein
MAWEKGLYQDSSESQQPEGTYRFAKNIIDSDVIGAKQNEPGFTALEQYATYKLIGNIPIDGNSVVLFSTDDIFNASEIGVVDLTTGVYTTVYNESDLNFRLDRPITGEFRKEVNNQRVIAWTDNYNSPRILNIDNPTGINDIQDINVFQDVRNPAITASVINDFGGSLLTGAYILLTKYRNQDGSETGWYVHDKTYYINDDAKSESFASDDGAAPGSSSNKSITITLENSDTRYDTLVVGYIQVVNNISTAHEAYTRTNSSTITVAITGTESTSDIALDEVLTSNASYNTAKTMTQLGGQLYMGNLSAEPIPDLQAVALKAEVNYTTDLINVVSNFNSHKDTLPPTFVPGDVYALYLGVELKMGGWAFYHIPGREVLNSEKATVVDGNLGLTYLSYQVNTHADNPSAPTNMGAWENPNELYPNHAMYDATSISGPDLRGLPVRHHRFPSTPNLITEHYTGNSNFGITELAQLGITVTGISFTTEQQSKFTRWKIFFARKRSSNSLFVGSDLFQAGNPTQDDANVRWSSGGNWQLEAQQAGSDGWKDFGPPSYGSLRGHSLDMLHEPGSAIPTYAGFQYKLRRSNLNTDFGGFRTTGARMTITGEARGQVASAVIDYTVPASTVRSAVTFNKRLDDFTYVPPNALNGVVKTQYTEGVFAANILNPASLTSNLTPIRLVTNSSGQTADQQIFRLANGAESPSVAEDTMYMEYFRLLSDVHTSFTQQDLIPTLGYANPGDTSITVSGGDGFACYMSFLTAAPTNSNPDSTLGAPYQEGVRIWRGYIGYSRKNFNYRYQIQGNLGTYYHGKTDVRTLFTPTVTGISAGQSYDTLVRSDQAQNIVMYDTTMNASNEYTVGIISSPDLVQATSFPNTVIWSPVQSEESKEFSWRSFPSGNRYTMSKNKGDIQNLQGIKNKELILHTTNSIYRTRTDANIQAEAENVFLKSANLFDLPPEELVPTKTGYGGTQNQLACVLTKAGYIYPDDYAGKVFLYDGSNLQEISTHGNRNFFRDYMGIKAQNVDNPYNGFGYTVGYDEGLNRIIISKKHELQSWTMSYNPLKQCWVSYHDYVPDCILSTLNNNCYVVSSNLFYSINSNRPGVYFQVDPEPPYPCYIDLTFSSPQDRLFGSVQWVTEVRPSIYETAGQLDVTKTFTHITVSGPDQADARTAIVPFVGLDGYEGYNVRNINRTWSYNDLRDITTGQGFKLGFYNNYDLDPNKLDMNMEWYDRRYFIDKYLTCRLEHDNLSGDRILLLEADVTYTDVKR